MSTRAKEIRELGNTGFLELDANGNLGIGTDAPQVKLHIKDGTVSTTYLSDDVLTVESDGTTNINLVTPVDSASYLIFSDTTRSRGSVGYIHSSDTMDFRTAGGSRMTLNGTGTLDVTSSTSAIALKLHSSSTTGTGMYLDNTSRSGGYTWGLLSGNVANGYFSIKDETNAQTRLTIDTSGNVSFLGPMINLPTDTTAPSGGVAGSLYYNTNDNVAYFYTGTEWRSSSYGSFIASGGTKTTSGQYTYHTFNSSGTFTVESGTAEIEYLIQAGGAGGSSDRAGGGGAGGAIARTTTVSKGTFPVIVGAGGAGGPTDESYGTAGGDSSFVGDTAIGGGTGGFQQSSTSLPGISGGCGGGGCGGDGGGASGGSGTSGQGTAGGAGETGASGGGGGTGTSGVNATTTQAGAGGSGYTWLDGVQRGGGGGGGTDPRKTVGRNVGAGGAGGGGRGGAYSSVNGGPQNSDLPALAGTTNTGSGGGGGGLDPNNAGMMGASGGSGVVIIRYLTGS
jgi:hypothetical protein